MYPIRMLVAAGLVAIAAPAMAQQYWLPNGPGGTTWNNPQGSLLGTMNEHLLQRHAWQYRNGQRPAQPGQAATQQAATSDPSFRLTNRASTTMNEVYVSAVEEQSWGADRLGQNVLPSGQQMIVRLPMGQCVNDIRVVYADGQAFERRRVNTCALVDMVFP